MKSFATLAAAAAALLSVTDASAIVKRTPPLQPSCTDYTPFNYGGCYVDHGDPKPALIYRAINLDSQNTTIDQCVAFCKGNNWRYAGLEYYGICFCGSSVTGELVSDSECNTPCKANASQACGGNGRISIYQDPTFIPISQTTIADYIPVGCYSEGPNGRTLNWRNDDVQEDALDVNSCLTACRDDGFPLAGVEFGRECWCGVVLANGTQVLDSSSCDFPCSGDPSQTCGGAGALNLYVAKNLDSQMPCKDSLIPVFPGLPSTTSRASSTTTTQSSTTTSQSPTTTTQSSTTTSQSPTTTSSQPPATTSTTTRSSVATTTTTTRVSTTASLCTTYTTTTPVPDCEYKVGNWCSKPLPPYTDKDNCKVASSQCLVQASSCFLQAGWPQSLDCFKYKLWCLNVASFCNDSCPGSRCSHSNCKSKYPPAGNPTLPSPVVSSSVGPCSTTSASTTTRVSSTTAIPVPTPSCLCEQPHNPSKGYTRDNPLGDIDLSCLTCNNVYSDYKSGNWFKVYNNPDSSRCPSYTKNSIPQGCKKACDNQYSACVNVYAESCKNGNRKRNYSNGPQRGANGPKYDSAMDACKNQWQDCYTVNANKNAGNRCSSWNSGW